MLNEIITIFSNPITQVISTPLIATIVTTIFLRKKTKVEEFEKLKSGKFEEVTEGLLQSGIMSYSEFYKINNFAKIAKKADVYYNELKQTKKREEIKYDIDWFFRLYDAVGNISNEQLQELWAKLIANEFVNPSFSYRILDLMKNLSCNDAVKFERICDFSIFNDNKSLFIPLDNEFFVKNGVEVSSILLMDELGLIHAKDGISLKNAKNNVEGVAFWNKEILISCISQNSSDFARIYPFTELGIELATIVGRTIKNNVLLDYVKCLKKKNISNGITYKAYKIKEYSKDKKSFEPGEEIIL